MIESSSETLDLQKIVHTQPVVSDGSNGFETQRIFGATHTMLATCWNIDFRKDSQGLPNIVYPMILDVWMFWNYIVMG